MGAWEEVTRLPRTPATYHAWRELAAARVRRSDLAGAVTAYREADKLAPAEDRAEIASRLGWLSKTQGDSRAAGRYFSRARGTGGAFPVTPILVAITVVVSLVASLGGTDGGQLLDTLALDKVAIAHGEVWRLWSVVLVHAPVQQDPLHLLFNMYMLWIIGPVVERLYGWWRFLGLYLLFALGASLMTFAVATDPNLDRFAVGASGAIFGLVGVVVAAGWVHRPMLSNMRGLIQQLIVLIVLNLVLGFTGQGIDNWAHIGGLVTGLWTGVLLAPTAVPTLRSMWLRPGPLGGPMVPVFGATGNVGLRVAGFLALAAFLALLWSMGLTAWS
jgi:membrane associated rhomboid family serine protease